MQHSTKIAFIIAVSLHAALGCVITLPATTKVPEAPAAYMEVSLCDAPSANDPDARLETVSVAPVEEIAPPETIAESAPEPVELVPEAPISEPSPIVIEPKPPASVAKRKAPSSRPSTTAALAKGSSKSTGGGNYEATGNVSFLHRPAPVYPTAALQARQTGRVVLMLYINEFGKVDRVETQTSSGVTSLDAAATTAAKKSTFRPAVSAGRPVKSKATVPFSFQIKS
jgi:protein TonB